MIRAWARADSWRTLAEQLIAAVATLVLLAGCTGPDGRKAAGTSTATTVGSVQTDLRPCPEQTNARADDRKLPDITLPCFNGGTLDLSKAPGKPTVINLWASWCPPCRSELPLMQHLADAAGDRMQVVGVVSNDGIRQAASFAGDAGTTFPSAYDGDGDVMAGLGISDLPYTYFLTADGAVAHVQVGEVTSLADLKQLVRQYLSLQL